MFISNMLIPVMDKFKTLVAQLLVETDEQKQELLAQTLCHAMAVTSRASKAFTNHQTMKSCCCVPVFVEATKVFLGCLQVIHIRTLLYALNCLPHVCLRFCNSVGLVDSSAMWTYK
jgi:hypothetical protein